MASRATRAAVAGSSKGFPCGAIEIIDVETPAPSMSSRLFSGVQPALPGTWRVDREITIYLPLYMGVKVLGIGVDPEARLQPARHFAGDNGFLAG